MPKPSKPDRRAFLQALGAGALSATGGLSARLLRGSPGSAESVLAGRPLVRYPEKTDLILLTSRPPQLETPMHYFKDVITPNDAFYVRYHIPPPSHVDLGTWRLKIGGYVRQPLSLSMDDLRGQFAAQKVIAVNQCSGNSRGLFSPRVMGGQWANGAMGNACWTGVSLRDLLDRAGLRKGAVEVSFNGLDQPVLPTTPDLVKSLPFDHILNHPDVLIAYEMNGQPIPMLNGFPARLIVPGWYGTYWVKNLSDITVFDQKFQGFWMRIAYRIPDNACACVPPGSKPAATVPISRMDVRSFIISPAEGARLQARKPFKVQGIAFDGGYGISDVTVSTNGGKTWRSAKLSPELSRYSFRQWTLEWTPPVSGAFTLMARATNRIGQSQPLKPKWNPAGYMRNVVERVDVRVD
jgi:sulfite dehydrogenase (cytochrome) subunit A